MSHAAVIGELMAAGAKGGEALLRSAAAADDIAMVKAILTHGKPTAVQLTAAWKATKNKEVIEAAQESRRQRARKDRGQGRANGRIEPYIGAYRDESGTELAIDLDGSRWPSSCRARRLFTLNRDKEDVFKIEEASSTVAFQRQQGKIVALTLKSSGNSDRIYKRVAATSIAKKKESLPAVVEPTGVVPKPLNWPQFRGIGATGVADGQFPPTSFDVPKGKNVRWKTADPRPGPFMPGDLGRSCLPHHGRERRSEGRHQTRPVWRRRVGQGRHGTQMVFDLPRQEDRARSIGSAKCAPASRRSNDISRARTPIRPSPPMASTSSPASAPRASIVTIRRATNSGNAISASSTAVGFTTPTISGDSDLRR